MTIKDCIKREMIFHLEEKPGILPGTATPFTRHVSGTHLKH